MKKHTIIALLIMTLSFVVLAGCSKEAAQTAEISTESVNLDTESETEQIQPETEPETAVEIETETEVEVEPVVATVTMYAQKKVNVRSLPSTDGEVRGSLSTNDPVIVVGDLTSEGWYQVTYCDQTGYIKGSYLGTGTVEVKQQTSSGTKSSSGTASQSTSTGSGTSASSGTSTPATASGSEGSVSGSTSGAASTPAQSDSGATSTPAQTPSSGNNVDAAGNAIVDPNASAATQQVQQAIIDNGGYMMPSMW